MCHDRGPNALAHRGGNPAVYNFSAFVVEIKERWFAITAGHVFDDLKKAISHGAVLTDWVIDDSIVSDTPLQPQRTGFDMNMDVFYLYSDGMDYACFELNYFARQALIQQGIAPIPRVVWAAQDIAEFSTWLLVGTPTELAILESDAPYIKNHVTVRLERLSQRPADMDATEFERGYARIDFASVVDGEDGFDIKGMSGGPIFGLLPSTRESPFDYRLIGVQSKRLGSNVAFCYAYSFIRALEQAIETHR
jgi:hypothetical protein